MKTLVLSVFFCLSILSSSNIYSQASCPQIVTSTFQITTDFSNPCLRTVHFDFINPTNGNKRINLTISLNGVELINTCIDASGQKDVQRSYTSASFSACNLSGLDIAITPFTGSSCSGTSCAPVIRSVAGAPLPVTFSSFTATRNNTAVQLKWETSTEINNSGFAVERNTNGNWEQIAFVPSQTTDGNSSNKLAYQYNDNNNSKGVTQYRLRQVDFDEQFKYSEVRAIRSKDQQAKTITYPNPSFDGNVTIVFAEVANRDIILVDVTGKTIKQYSSFSSNTLQLNNLTPGMYSITSFDKTSNTRSTEKVVVSGR